MRRTALANLLLFAFLPFGLIGCDARYEARVGVADTELSEGNWVGIHHVYFPVPLGTQWVYEGLDDGRHLLEENQALDSTQSIDGVECVGLAERRYLDGLLVETTLEWFAQDKSGNVWAFGEESMAWNGSEFVRSEDSWQAGLDGAQAVLFLPAVPQVGDRFDRHLPDGTETLLVVSTTAMADAAIGSFVGCLEMIENPDDADADIILYARGVGRVAQSDRSGGSAIVLYRRPR